MFWIYSNIKQNIKSLDFYLFSSTSSRLNILGYFLRSRIKWNSIENVYISNFLIHTKFISIKSWYKKKANILLTNRSFFIYVLHFHFSCHYLLFCLLLFLISLSKQCYCFLHTNTKKKVVRKKQIPISYTGNISDPIESVYYLFWIKYFLLRRLSIRLKKLPYLYFFRRNILINLKQKWKIIVQLSRKKHQLLLTMISVFFHWK